MISCRCHNCEEDFADVPNGDYYGVHCPTCRFWFCSETCFDEHECNPVKK